MDRPPETSPTRRVEHDRHHQEKHELRPSHATHAHKPTKDLNAPPAKHNDRVGPVATQVNGNYHQQPNGNHQSSRGYASHIDVKFDAIDRIQTQVNLNRASLESCTREMQRIDATVQRIEANQLRMQQQFGEHFDGLRLEMMEVARQQQAQVAGPPPGERLDDQTLEVFSANLQTIAGKANEVDSLKIQIELLRRRLRRVEELNVSPSLPPMAPSREAALQHPNHGPPQRVNPAMTQRTHPTARQDSAHQEATRQETRPIVQHPHQRHAGMDSHQQIEGQQALEPGTAPSGWVSVNTGSKRGHPNEVEGIVDMAGSRVDSPKRPKLAPLEPGHLHNANPIQGPAPPQLDRLDPRESENSVNPYRRPSHEIHPDAIKPRNFHPYAPSPDAPHDEQQRQHQQRAASGPLFSATTPTTQAARPGRPRGRGGRPRKFISSDIHSMHLQVNDWERDGFPAGLQNDSPDSHYYSANTPHPGLDMRRRSSVAHIGLGRSSLPPQTPQSAIGDPYAHTKKTRTKPIRNSDGILIRKDGRPDMRSQSSAANLRKVHARKEEDQQGGSETPTSGPAAAPPLTAAPTTASNSRAQSPASLRDEELGGNMAQERAEMILKQMFPHGVDEQRGRVYSSDRYLSPGSSRSPQERAARSSEEQQFAPSPTAEDHEPKNAASPPKIGRIELDFERYDAPVEEVVEPTEAEISKAPERDVPEVVMQEV